MHYLYRTTEVSRIDRAREAKNETYLKKLQLSLISSQPPETRAVHRTGFLFYFKKYPRQAETTRKINKCAGK